jgi:hypothetical protein
VIATPSPGVVLRSGEFAVTGYVTCTGGLAEVRVCGKKADLYQQGNGVYAFTNVVRREDGEHLISVRAVATFFPRLESRAVMTVSVDATPPDVTILRPADFAAFEGVNVHVTVRTDSTNDMVTINGCQTTRDGYIRYAWVKLDRLGTNTVCATSINETGQLSSDSIEVLCSRLTSVDPNDTDCDGVPDPQDPDPNNASVISRIKIEAPLNGAPFRPSRVE